ncbi:RNA polymerase sigma factor [Chryseolinea sp. T2]|uniref:RNA polymerase sigma factor n=1 Tax=Chryseolinea sp. T2 TaxID=3129255 RepID=UPI00307787CB
MQQYKELLAGCHREDANSQRILYDLFKARLMGLCRRYTNNREEAKDVLQESFIKIFRKIHQVTESGKLESWMKSVVVNTAIDHFRKKNVLKTGPIDETVTEEVKANAEAQVSDEILMTMVNQLPDGCRLVFNLYVVEGYSHAEIATMLDITESTSRSQLNYAKSALKNKLKCHDVTQYYEKFA